MIKLIDYDTLQVTFMKYNFINLIKCEFLTIWDARRYNYFVMY